MDNTLKRWSLLEFIREYGKLSIGNFVNKETGEEFKGLVFTEPEGKQTFAAFSQQLGELTAQQIKEQKDVLEIVQLPSGVFCLVRAEGSPIQQNAIVQDSLAETDSTKNRLPGIWKNHKGKIILTSIAIIIIIPVWIFVGFEGVLAGICLICLWFVMGFFAGLNNMHSWAELKSGLKVLAIALIIGGVSGYICWDWVSYKERKEMSISIIEQNAKYGYDSRVKYILEDLEKDYTYFPLSPLTPKRKHLHREMEQYQREK